MQPHTVLQKRPSAFLSWQLPWKTLASHSSKNPFKCQELNKSKVLVVTYLRFLIHHHQQILTAPLLLRLGPPCWDKQLDRLDPMWQKSKHLGGGLGGVSSASSFGFCLQVVGKQGNGEILATTHLSVTDLTLTWHMSTFFPF